MKNKEFDEKFDFIVEFYEFPSNFGEIENILIEKNKLKYFKKILRSKIVTPIFEELKGVFSRLPPSYIINNICVSFATLHPKAAKKYYELAEQSLIVSNCAFYRSI